MVSVYTYNYDTCFTKVHMFFYFYGIGSCLRRLDTLKTCQLEDWESMRAKKWRLAEDPHGKIPTSKKYLGKSEDLCLAK